VTPVAHPTDGQHAIELDSINNKTVVRRTVASHPLNHLLANYNRLRKAEQG